MNFICSEHRGPKVPNVLASRWLVAYSHMRTTTYKSHDGLAAAVILAAQGLKVTQGIESRIESPIESVTQSLKVSSQGHTQGIESRYRVKVTQGIESRELKVSRSVSVSQRFTTTTGTVSMAQNSIDRVAIVAEEPEKNGNHSRL